MREEYFRDWMDTLTSLRPTLKICKCYNPSDHSIIVRETQFQHTLVYGHNASHFTLAFTYIGLIRELFHVKRVELHN